MEKGRYLHDFKEASFRPSSIGADSSEGGREGGSRPSERATNAAGVVRPTRSDDSRTDVSPSRLRLLLLLLLRRRRRPSLDPNLAKKTHLKRGGGGQKSQADRGPGRGRRGT